MINCNECFLAGTKVCKNERSVDTIPSSVEECDYFITKDGAVKEVIHNLCARTYANEQKAIMEKDRIARLKKDILDIRFRLTQHIEEPWRFSIINRFTYEQIEDFIKRDYYPGRDFLHDEAFTVNYAKSEEELKEIAIGNLREWISDEEDKVLEIEKRIPEAKVLLTKF